MNTKAVVRSLYLGFVWGLSWWGGGAMFSGQAAVINVLVTNYAFLPPTVVINANDQVLWTWGNDGLVSHSTTSDTNGLWNSTLQTAPFSFAHTFAAAGVFPYQCTLHVNLEHMTGTVTVADAPPGVTITNPPNGAILSAPASLLLAATASDSDGSVTNVQFLQGTTTLGNTTTSPYTKAVNSLGAGDYTFSAVASDNGGLKATNAITVHVVTPVPIVLSGQQRLSASGFQFSYSANVGLRYAVLRSGSLPGFTPINTNTAASNPVTFLDTNATGVVNFYRVQLLPNP